MEYHRLVNIPTWNSIRDRFKNRIKNIKNQRQIVLSAEAKNWLSGQLLPDITALTNKRHTITYAILFIQQPKSECSIHVDGINPTREGHPDWALNIPITESDAEMSWYEGVYSLNTKDSQGLPYLDIEWLHGPNLAKTVKVDKPMFVNIDKPHKVVNFSNHVRMILSVRFSPDISITNLGQLNSTD
jgi:hypothetical protein